MIGSSIGTLFRYTTFGESHGPALGVVIEGCPAGFSLSREQIQAELNRRRPGQSQWVSPRREPDEFEILSGVFEDRTSGAPLLFLVRNEDAKSKDYDAIKDLFRPGHADYSYHVKYGVRDYRGGGRSSARETVGRVIAGAIAKQLLQYAGIAIRGGVVQIADAVAEHYHWDQVEGNEFRAVDPHLVPRFQEIIEKARKERDSVGGVVEVQALGVEAGLGEPTFGKLDALLAGALMSIPAVKGVEIGAGFRAASMRGSEMNDLMHPEGFASNHHGGILGGISTGAPIVCRCAIKPTSSLPKEQETITTAFTATKVKTLGRHDPCVALRAVPIAEALVAVVLLDLWLQHHGARALQTLGGVAPPQMHYGLSLPDGVQKS